MGKNTIAKIFIAALIALIIVPVVVLGVLAIKPGHMTVRKDSNDSATVMKVPGSFDTVPDTTIAAPPNPHKLYVVGKTLKTVYGMSSTGYTTANGFLVKEQLTISQGPAILLKIDKNTRAIYPHNSINNYTNLVYLKDAKRIQLFFHINPKYLSQYRYRILVNDSTYIQWKQPESTILVNDLFPGVPDSSFYDTNDNIPESIKEKRRQDKSVLLADVDVYDKTITLQLYNLDNPKGTSTVIIRNKPFERPKITGIYAAITKKTAGGRISEGAFNIANAPSSGDLPSKERKWDVHINELTGFRLWVNHLVDTKFYTVSIQNISTVFSKAYEIPLGNHYEPGYIFDLTPSRVEWTVENPEKFIKKPGTYKITVTPQLPNYRLRFRDSATSAEFTILPASEEANTYSLWQVLSYLWIFLVVVLLIFLWYRTRQKKRLRQYQLQTQITKAQLNAIRLQLNPHFVFNALSGIQNLINKNEIDNANRYLKRFSRLTRSVLDEDFNESIPMADEINLLDDYLKMEQLRFGFQYTIHAGEHIDLENTEIPSMLVQPFVENAVKYGVYQKGSEGRINIDIVQEDRDIILRVHDNGTGFDTAKEYDGLGIKLSRSRIDLLNTLQKSAKIILDLNSGDKGTIVSFRLKDWI